MKLQIGSTVRCRRVSGVEAELRRLIDAHVEIVADEE